MVVKPHICEAFGIIHFFVETYDRGYIVLPEVWKVCLRSMEWVTCGKQQLGALQSGTKKFQMCTFIIA